MTAEIAATRDGKVTGLRVHTIADHGAFDACADPSKWPAGFFNIVTGSYDYSRSSNAFLLTADTRDARWR